MGYRHKTMSDRPLADIVAQRDALRTTLHREAGYAISQANLTRIALLESVLTQNIEIRTGELQP